MASWPFWEKSPGSSPKRNSSLLPVICRQLAGTIRSAQFSLQAKKRIAELTTLHTIGMAISSISELGELLNRITLSSAKLLQADGSILRLLDEEGGALKVVSSFGLEEGANSLSPVQLGEDVAGIVALTGEPMLIPDVNRSPHSFTKFSPDDFFGRLRAPDFQIQNHRDTRPFQQPPGRISEESLRRRG